MDLRSVSKYSRRVAILVVHPGFLEILGSVYHSHQIDPICQGNVENYMRLGRETADYSLFRYFRTFTTHQRLLCQVTNDVVKPSQIFIRAPFAGFIRDVSPNSQ